MGNGRRYTDDERQFVRDNYKTISDERLAEMLHVTPQAVEQLRKRMGLKLKPAYKMMTPEEVKFALSHADKSCREIGKLLNRPTSTINHLLARVRHGLSDEGKYREGTSKPIPPDWKPSHIPCEICDDVKRHVELLKRVYGTYGGRT